MQRPRVPAIRRANVGADGAGCGRLRRCTVALAAIALPLALPLALPQVAHAAPPAPEAAPADPTTPTTTPTTTSPTTEPTVDAPPTSTPVPVTPATPPATPVTAVVLADVATGAPPLVPQLASQGAATVGGAASFARPAGPALPVTGGAEPSLGLLAAVFGVVGAALVCLARRRHPV